MLGYSWTPIAANAAGSALANSTTPTSLLGSQAKFTLPANFLSATGQTLRFRAAGNIGTVVTTPGTLTLDIRFGSTIVATSPAFALNIVSQSSTIWILNWDLTLRGVGSAAQFMHLGMWTSSAAVGGVAASVGGAASLMIPATTPAVGTAFDSTAAQQIDFFATWSVASSSNTITLQQFSIDSIN
jgi:hypothetical protein